LLQGIQEATIATPQDPEVERLREQARRCFRAADRLADRDFAERLREVGRELEVEALKREAQHGAVGLQPRERRFPRLVVSVLTLLTAGALYVAYCATASAASATAERGSCTTEKGRAADAPLTSPNPVRG
jgi:hypothetical protein